MYGAVFLGFSFTLKLFPFLSHKHIQTPTTFKYLNIHSVNYYIFLALLN